MQTPSLTTIHLATDHAGYRYKELIKSFLEQKGYKVLDHGAYEFDPGDDYPNFVAIAAKFVSDANNDDEVGIVLGASGQGEAIAAMKYPHIRTTVCYGGPMAEEIVQAGKNHNNANVLSLGAKYLEEKEVLHLVELWLTTPFSREERHLRRLTEIEKLEK